MRWFLPGWRRVNLRALRQEFQAFQPALAGQGPALAGAILLSLLLVGLELLRPWPIKLIFDDVLVPSIQRQQGGFAGLSARDLLLACCLAVILIGILIGTLRLARTVLAAKVGRRITTRVRRRLFEHLHRLAFPFHQSSRSGDLLVRLLGDVNMVRDLIFNSWVSLLERGTVLVGTAVVMVALDLPLGLLALMPLPLLVLGLGRSSKKLRQVTRKQRKKEGSAAAFAAETLRQIRVVKAYAAEETATQRFTRDSRGGERAGAEAARITARMGRLAEFLTGTGLALVLFFGAQRVLDGSLSAGELLVIVSYARSVYKPLRGLSKEGGRLARASACADRLLEVLRLPPEPAHAGPPAPAFRGEIVFDRVSYSYSGGLAALHEISLRVGEGKLVLVAGPNGAGKSTLISLLLRLLEPESGCLLIDGLPVSTWSLHSYRERFAYVPQEIQLFGATVRENILYGRPDASEAEVENAMNQALVSECVAHLPQGLDTELSEAGGSLSGGEARRVMLARAALRDARILLLDEPLSGIDPEARPLVARAIRSIAAGRTTLVVSHDASTDLDPDLVVHLKAGRLQRIEERPTVEAGS